MKNLITVMILIVVLTMFTTIAKAEDLFDYEYYKGSGLVTAGGMKLLLIDESAGNVPPLERARIVSERLNAILDMGNISPENFRVGYYNEQVVLEYMPPGSSPFLIATVDSKLAQKFHGAHGSRTTLAYWWLSLLRDNLLISEGHEPLYTAPYGTGYIFERIYMKAIQHSDYEGGPIDISIIEDVIEELADEDMHFQYDFERLYTSVPANFNLSSASNLDGHSGYTDGPSFSNNTTAYNSYSPSSPSVPGPAFDDSYATNTVDVPSPSYEPYSYDPAPQPEYTYTEDTSVSYSPPYEEPSYEEPSYEEPVYYEDSTYYYEPYYEPEPYYAPSPDLPSDSPQPLPTDYDYLLKKQLNLNLCSDSGNFNSYIDDASSEAISQVKYKLMDFDKKEIDSMVTKSQPFTCNLHQSSDAKFLQVDILYKNGQEKSMIYKLFPTH